MNQTELTFVLDKDGLQASTLCLESALGLYFAPGEAPLALGGYGSVFKCFQATADGRKPCAIKMIPLSVGGRTVIEEEYSRLCAVLHIPGTVKVLQPPFYSATHGFLLTEYVAFCRQHVEQHQITQLIVKRCQLLLTGSMTCRLIQGDSLAEHMFRAASVCLGSSIPLIMQLTMQWKRDVLQELCLVSIVVLRAGAHLVLNE